MKGLLLFTALSLCVCLCRSAEKEINNVECKELVLVAREFDPIMIQGDGSCNRYPVGTEVELNYFEAPPWSYLY